MGFLIFILIWVVIAVICNWRIRNFGAAFVVSFLLSFFGTAAALWFSGPDKFFLVALFFLMFYTLGISLLVSIPFGIVRHRQFLESERGSTCKKCGYDLRGSVSGFCTECGKSYIGPD